MADPFEDLRKEMGLRPPPAPKPRTKKQPRVYAPFPDPEQGPLEPCPWADDGFNPADPELYTRVKAGQQLTCLILGASVYLVDGVRWIEFQNPVNWWNRTFWLCYPLPERFGADPYDAVTAFKRAWQEERQRRRTTWPDTPKG